MIAAANLGQQCIVEQILPLCVYRAMSTSTAPMPSQNSIFAPFSAMDAASSPRHSVVMTTNCPSVIIVIGKAILTHRSIGGSL